MTFDRDPEEQDLHALELDERQVQTVMNLHSRHLFLLYAFETEEHPEMDAKELLA